MDTKPVKDKTLRRGNPPSGQSHEDFLAEIRETKITSRLSDVMDVLNIDEASARKLINALVN